LLISSENHTPILSIFCAGRRREFFSVSQSAFQGEKPFLSAKKNNKCRVLQKPKPVEIFTAEK